MKKTRAKGRAKVRVSRRSHPREAIEAGPPSSMRKESEIPASLLDIADLIGSVEGLPSDLGANHKKYLRLWGYGRKRRRD
jgi:hypothetical protein